MTNWTETSKRLSDVLGLARERKLTDRGYIVFMLAEMTSAVKARNERETGAAWSQFRLIAAGVADAEWLIAMAAFDTALGDVR